MKIKNKKNVLVIDVGNSYVKFALFENENKILKHFFCKTNLVKRKTFIKSFLLKHLSTFKFEQVMIGSVVPKNNKFFEEVFEKYWNIKPYVINANTKFNFQIDKKMKFEEIGHDIFALAAYCSNYSKNLVGFSFGTAIFAIVLINNVLKGVSIVNGLSSSVKALTNQTSLIKNKKSDISTKLIYGNTTETSINSGLWHLKNGFVKNFYYSCMENFQQNNLFTIITGFESKNFELDFDYLIDENAILIGYYLIHKKNKF